MKKLTQNCARNDPLNCQIKTFHFAISKTDILQKRSISWKLMNTDGINLYVFKDR